MKKKGKRLLALLLVMAIVITGLPISGMQIQSQAASKKTAVQKVTLNHSQYVMKKGQKLKLKAAVRPQKAKTKLKVYCAKRLKKSQNIIMITLKD